MSTNFSILSLHLNDLATSSPLFVGSQKNKFSLRSSSFERSMSSAYLGFGQLQLSKAVFKHFASTAVVYERQYDVKYTQTQFRFNSGEIAHCLFHECHNSDGNGGGLNVTGSDVNFVISDCQFVRCSALNGGGIHVMQISSSICKRSCFIGCFSDSLSPSARIVLCNHSEFEENTVANVHREGSHMHENLVFTNLDQTVDKLNCSHNQGVKSVSCILFQNRKTGGSTIKYSTVSFHTETFSVIALRVVSSSEGVHIHHLNVYNNSNENGGLFNLQAGQGHTVEDSAIFNNEHSYTVGWRNDFSKGRITFRNCFFDSVISSSDAEVVQENVLFVSSPATVNIRHYREGYCANPSNAFSVSLKSNRYSCSDLYAHFLLVLV